MGPKEIRKRCGLSMIAAAVGAGVAEGTLRLYEASRNAVSEEKRAKLDHFFERLQGGHASSQFPEPKNSPDEEHHVVRTDGEEV